MGIVKKLQAPQQGVQIVSSALSDLQGHPGNAALLGGAAVDLSQALPVFQLRLSDITQAVNIGAARLVGWRYLISRQGTAAYGYADVAVTEKGGIQFSSFASNRNGARLVEAVRLAEQAAEALPSEEHEARILDVPALKLSMIWLAGTTAKFIPFIDGRQLGDWTPRVLAADELFERLVLDARLARQSSLDGG